MMQFNFVRKKNIKLAVYFFNILTGILVLLASGLTYAKTIIIKDKQVVDKSVVYKNAVLDLSSGNFILTKAAVLDIEDSVINVTISPSNPFFLHLVNGSLILKNNVMNVTVTGIPENPHVQSLYQVIKVDQGTLNLDGNHFIADTPYTVSFMKTNPAFMTSGYNIVNNTFKNFHGALYLLNTNNADVNDNTFTNVSFSNIYNSGDASSFRRNLFLFPGNLAEGNALDLINSAGLTVSNNIISSSAGYGIFMMGCQNIHINHNKITDGAGYGIFIQTPMLAGVNKNKLIANLVPNYKARFISNSDISVKHNYIALNRYGLAGEVVDNLTVENNVFIQRFEDNVARQFWTNNDNLLPLVTNLTWLNNLYKEAFTQEVPGDNQNSLQFVHYPAHGGVSLP